jgi:hypothetical protein
MLARAGRITAPWFAALAPHRSGSLRCYPQQRLGLAHVPSRFK